MLCCFNAARNMTRETCVSGNTSDKLTTMLSRISDRLNCPSDKRACRSSRAIQYLRDEHLCGRVKGDVRYGTFCQGGALSNFLTKIGFLPTSTPIQLSIAQLMYSCNLHEPISMLRVDLLLSQCISIMDMAMRGQQFGTEKAICRD